MRLINAPRSFPLSLGAHRNDLFGIILPCRRFYRRGRFIVQIASQELHSRFRRENAVQIIVMNIDIISTGTEGEQAGRIPFIVPVQPVIRLVIKDEDEPPFLLFLGEAPPADPCPA
jgi:hypothetical protein